MLNRSAVVVRYREAFRDWLRFIGVEEEEFQDHEEKSVYLIGECDYPEDQEEVLQESAADSSQPSANSSLNVPDSSLPEPDSSHCGFLAPAKMKLLVASRMAKAATHLRA